MKAMNTTIWVIGIGTLWTAACVFSEPGTMRESEKKTDDRVLQMLVSDTNSPVKFDPKVKEYELVFRTVRNGREVLMHVPLAFSPFTGKPLRSGREALFQEPSQEEEDRMMAKLSGSRSLHEVEKRLGKPDTVYSNGGSWKIQYSYTNVCRTVEVIIQERQDGHIDTLFSPKVKQ